MPNLARTFRTVRHLRASQLYWRLRFRCETARPVVSSTAPATLIARKDFPLALLEKAEHQPANHASAGQLVESLQRGCFEHLNESRELGSDPIDWLLGPRDENRLWTITLHYHHWAWRLAQIVRKGGDLGRRADGVLRRRLGDWITRCDLTVDGSRDLAWCAYAIATRLGWWCRLYHLLGPEGRASWGKLDSVFLESAWSQASYLSRHLEKDLRANHLLRDAVGLAWAGRFLEGPRPREWFRTATELAVEQAREQVLPDGGHFERSPMYHVEIMDDFLVLGQLLEDDDARRLMRDTWRQMAEFLAWVRHPDGRVPLLNDGGLNGACSPDAMFDQGKRLLDVDVDGSPRRGGRLFGDFGLAVWHGEPWDIFFDVGPVGVDYQPGHAHADTLTLEASYEGRRVFVDPGTLRYDNDESRRYDRATASHNTLAIDDADSSEVWHIFRVGRRARPIGVQFEATAERMRVSGTHNGYDRLKGRPRHRRQVDVDPSGCFTMTDRFEGGGTHTVAGGLLVAPGWQVETVEGGWRLSCDSAAIDVALEAPESVRPELREADYHPEYGLVVPTSRLAWRGELEFPSTIVVRVTPRESAQSRE